MKYCSKCGIEKDRSCFYKHNETADGLRPECKDCHSVCVENAIIN